MRSFMGLTFLFVALAVLLTAAVGLPPPEAPYAGTARVTVSALGPAGLAIEGSGSVLSMEIGAQTLAFEVPVASIDTGIELRNRHLRELLEVDRFPFARLELPRAAVDVPEPGQVRSQIVEGRLTLHGVMRPVSVEYRAAGGDDGRSLVSGSFALDLRDNGMAAPAWLGLKVAPGIKVAAELSLEKR
jgi:polyisoprenoid-binding protein YceI